MDKVKNIPELTDYEALAELTGDKSQISKASERIVEKSLPAKEEAKTTVMDENDKIYEPKKTEEKKSAPNRFVSMRRIGAKITKEKNNLD